MVHCIIILLEREREEEVAKCYMESVCSVLGQIANLFWSRRRIYHILDYVCIRAIQKYMGKEVGLL